MSNAQHTVTIRRPAADVFAFVADGENGPKWRPGVLDVAHVSGEGLGATYRQGVPGPMGRRVAADYEITTYRPNTLLEFRAIAGPVRPTGRYEFAEVEGGTRVTFSLAAELGFVKNLLMGSMVSKSMTSEVTSLEKLKSVLEA